MPQSRVLYNGVRLSTPWPPRRKRVTRRPMPVPYLRNRPRVVPIDVGRQLFVDEFLVEKSTLTRRFHRAAYHPDCPVMTGDRPWEWVGDSFYAAPFSDGVWYDPRDARFKMWYAGGSDCTCYAESDDGVHWRKPRLDVEPGTNVVVREPRDSSTIWLDHDDPNPARRFKMLCLVIRRRRWALALRQSPDGIHWSRPVAVNCPVSGDRTTFFYNPFRRAWVYSLRWFRPRGPGRIRAYREHRDLAAGLRDADAHAVPWLGADRLDPRHENPAYRDIVPQLYTVDAVAYESLLLGLYSVWQGPDNAESRRVGNHKRNEILLGFSRDGFHFSRPDRVPFIPVNETDGAWNWGNIQSAGGCCLTVGDHLYFYVSGRALDASGRQGNMATGLALLRRDGFASMDAGRRGGTLTTRPVVFSGRRLFVNAAARGGELRVELLDRAGRVLAPFSRARCRPVRGDSTCRMVTWQDTDDLAALAGCPVRFRFHLRAGSLYAFWVSPSRAGESRGYVAAGGPGFSGARDDVCTGGAAPA